MQTSIESFYDKKMNVYHKLTFKIHLIVRARTLMTSVKHIFLNFITRSLLPLTIAVLILIRFNMSTAKISLQL